MHNHPHGLGGKHLWVELKIKIGKVGKSDLKVVQDRLVTFAECSKPNAEHLFILARAAMFPRWTDLHHFSDIISESFTDAKKLEDVVKVVTYFHLREHSMWRYL